MKLKVVLALSTALAATPAVANPLGGALQSLGDAGNGNGNSAANDGNENGNGNALISGLDSSGMSLQDSDRANSGNGNGDDANSLAALQSGQDTDGGNDDTNGGDANPLAGLQPNQDGTNGDGNGDEASPSAELQPDQDGASDDGNGGSSPLAGLQPEQNGNDAGANGVGESPLEVRDAPADDGNGQPVIIENEGDKLIVGLRLDGRDGVLHDEIVPFASTDVVLSPEALSTMLYAEESDDWLRVAGLLSPERSFLDVEGEGDERVDTERENDVLRGLLQ